MPMAALQLLSPDAWPKYPLFGCSKWALSRMMVLEFTIPCTKHQKKWEATRLGAPVDSRAVLTRHIYTNYFLAETQNRAYYLLNCFFGIKVLGIPAYDLSKLSI